MKKEEKRIKRWKTGATKLQGTAYLRDMAEQGWLLEDMNHLIYTFREDEPQYLKYRILERDCVLTPEERETYEKDGWTEVCHYELEYIFVKKRDPFGEDTEEEKNLVLEELNEKIELEQKSMKSNHAGIRIYVLFFCGALIVMGGFSEHAFKVTAGSILQVLPWVVLGIVLSRRRMKKLRQEKEAVMEGDIPAEYADWRKSRRATLIFIFALILVIGTWIYYVSDFNEKTFDMPKEVSYAELPVVRVEELQDGNWKRVGEPVDLSREGVGIRKGTDFQRDREYEDAKFWGSVQNYGVEYKHLPAAERKVFMTQYMEEENTGELTGMQTMYWNYRMEFLAERKFEKMTENVKYLGPGVYSGVELEWTDAKREVLDIPKGALDELIVCKITGGKGERLQILARDGKQLMEMKYKGNVDVEKILPEISRVFSSQTE